MGVIKETHKKFASYAANMLTTFGEQCWTPSNCKSRTWLYPISNSLRVPEHQFIGPYHISVCTEVLLFSSVYMSFATNKNLFTEYTTFQCIYEASLKSLKPFNFDSTYIHLFGNTVSIIKKFRLPFLIRVIITCIFNQSTKNPRKHLLAWFIKLMTCVEIMIM